MKKFLMLLGVMLFAFSYVNAVDVLLFNDMAEEDEKPTHAVVMIKYFGTIPQDSTEESTVQPMERLLKSQVLSFSERRIPKAGQGYQTPSPDLWEESEVNAFLSQARERGLVTSPPASWEQLDFGDPTDILHKIVEDAFLNTSTFKFFPSVQRIEATVAAEFKGRIVTSDTLNVPLYSNQIQTHFCRTPEGDLKIILTGWQEYDFVALGANTNRIDEMLLRH